MPAEEKRISERATAAVHLIEEGRRMGKMASGEGSWINVMLARPENEMLCLVDHSFIIDTFNLYGLRHMVCSGCWLLLLLLFFILLGWVLLVLANVVAVGR